MPNPEDPDIGDPMSDAEDLDIGSPMSEVSTQNFIISPQAMQYAAFRLPEKGHGFLNNLCVLSVLSEAPQREGKRAVQIGFGE